MSERWSLERIRAFWTEQALLHGASPKASWSDVHAIELEIRNIAAFIEPGDRVLDVGCASGWSTVRWAAAQNATVRGLDYAPEMIEQARRRAAELAPQLAGVVEFAVGDATALEEPDGSWNKVVATRVIINLGSWDRQRRALAECARVVAPGGLLLLSEATLQGWQRLNAFRAEWGLAAIPVPPFNAYLDQDAVVAELEPELELVELRDFASSYYVGTRVLKPLLAQALGGRVDPAAPEMEWNRWCASLPPAGDYGVQKLFVFQKRRR
jgi:ubiquinone/menaquinone biosynthesis C-methylase UbiE